MNTQIVVYAIEPEHHGDWHDKPLRYSVRGPGAEVQKFSTKKEAQRYASIRRRSADRQAAYHTYAQS